MTRFLFHVLTLCAVALPLAAQPPCCAITAIQPNGTVTARVNSSGQTFEFTAKDAATLRSLKLGQPVYANFPQSQVSLDGKTASGRITSAPKSTAGGATSTAAPASTASIPPGQGAGWRLKHVNANLGGQQAGTDVWRLSGAAGVQASNLPAAYRDALARQAQNMPAGSVFLVSKPGVDKWLNTHPPGTPQSLNVNDVIHACDEKTESQIVPAHFNQTIDLPFTLNNTSLGGGVSATGSIDIKFPFSGNFNLEVQAFYNPCLFYVRPKALRTAGSMSFGAQMTVDIKKVNFQKDIPIPPQPLIFPLLEGAVLIEGVPVEAGIDLFIQGGVAINAQAQVDLRYSASGNAGGPFDFSCDGNGCGGSLGFTPSFTSSSSIGLTGNGVRASVKPYVFGGLQLQVEEGGVLRAQIGPRPYVVGDFWAYTGQNCGASGTALDHLATINALTADVDAGIDLRYQISAPIHKTDILAAPKPIHLGFWDLLGTSTGLAAGINGNDKPAAGTSTPYNVRMHSCYPYTDTIQYSVAFSDAASKDLGAGMRVPSTGSPQAGVTVNHTWPGPGTFSVSGTPLKDSHGRVFNTAPARLPVTAH